MNSKNHKKDKRRTNQFFKVSICITIIFFILSSLEGYKEYNLSKRNLIIELQNHFLAFFINPALNEIQSINKDSKAKEKLYFQLSNFNRCDLCHSKFLNQKYNGLYDKLKESITITVHSRENESLRFLYSYPFYSEEKESRKADIHKSKGIKNFSNPVVTKYAKISFDVSLPVNFNGKEKLIPYVFSFEFPQKIISDSIKNEILKKVILKNLYLLILIFCLCGIFYIREKRSLKNICEKIDNIRNNSYSKHKEYKILNDHKVIEERIDKLYEEFSQREDRITKQKKGLEYLNLFLNSLSQSSNIKEQIDNFAKYISRLVHFKRGCLLIFDDSLTEAVKFYSFDNKGNTFRFPNNSKIRIEQTYFCDFMNQNTSIVREVLADSSKTYAEDIFLVSEKKCTLLYSPLKSEKKLIGFITLLSEEKESFREKNIKYIEFLCQNLSISLLNTHLLESLKQSETELSSIFKITRILASSLDLSESFKELEREIKGVIDFDIFSITLPHEKERKKIKVLGATKKLPFYKVDSNSFDRENTSIDIVLDTGHPYIRKDTSKEHCFAEDVPCLNNGIFSYLIFPVWSKGKKVGTMNFYHKKKNSYSEQDFKLLKPISEQIGVAIENSELFNTIKKSQEEWVATFDSVKDHICIIGQNNIIIKANKSLANFLNKHPRELVGKKCYDVLYRSKTCREHCPHKEMMRSGKTETSEMKDESDNRNFLISVSPIFDEDGSIKGALHIARDITEEKNLKEQLIQAEKMASIGQLVSGVAHELNNPLAGINAYSQLLLEEKIDESLKYKVERIKIQSERAAKIVSNLLAFARKKKLEKIKTDINEVIYKSIELQQYELEAKKVNVVINLDENLPKVEVDPLQIQQVILNLLVNAEHSVIDAGRERGIINVSSSLIRKKEKNFIQICISDNGTGIKENILHKIFDPFFTTKEVGKGTGLGLSISYGIIKEHNGNIYAQNNETGGAKFIIELPSSSSDTQYNDNIIEFKSPVKREKPKSVLIVDDEDDLRECVKEYFNRKKYLVYEAKNGIEAVQTIKKVKNFDYIISDIRMPGIGGEELYNRISSEFPNLAKKILFITGDTINHKTINFLKNSSCPYILKPFTFVELEDNLHKLSA
ncbi:MAG: response regulator [Candidatus Schekmanbacteria bacterium]|nr:MAG: response regulator [Candidatus Schekmanbacteria bacterium]